jgi:hypothetical protein
MDENGTQTWTLYDSGNPIMDFNSSGSLTMRYVWGPTGIVARQTSGDTVSWYLADALRTGRDLINNSGAIIDHVDFGLSPIDSLGESAFLAGQFVRPDHARRPSSIAHSCSRRFQTSSKPTSSAVNQAVISSARMGRNRLASAGA